RRSFFRRVNFRIGIFSVIRLLAENQKEHTDFPGVGFNLRVIRRKSPCRSDQCGGSVGADSHLSTEFEGAWDQPVPAALRDERCCGANGGYVCQNKIGGPAQYRFEIRSTGHQIKAHQTRSGPELNQHWSKRLYRNPNCCFPASLNISGLQGGSKTIATSTFLASGNWRSAVFTPS